MDLIAVHYENFESVSKTAVNADLLFDYSDVFEDDQGSLPGVAHFVVDETVSTVTSSACRAPHAIKSKVKAELEKLIEREIIAHVKELTSWCNHMVVATKKPWKLQICIDPRSLSKAFQREHYPLSVMEGMLPKLSGARVFSKLDLSNAYWYVHPDEEWNFLTTFQTPYGRYRWKRIPFGTSVSSELFQKRLDQALEGLSGVLGVSDDIVVYGEGDDDEPVSKDHDRNLTALLKKCQDVVMKLSKERAELWKTEISFLGYLVMSDGG